MQIRVQGEAMNDQIGTVRRPAEGSIDLPVTWSGAAGGPGGSQTNRARADAAYVAQMLGAAGRQRGLKGGAPVLDAACRAYLETEWSGRGDRRGGPGALALMRI